MRLYAFPSIHIGSACLFCLLAVGGNLPGQTNSAAILGSVLTQVNQPVPKAFVSATRTALPPLRQTVQSAADGSFSFHNLPAGAYYLCVQPVTDGFLDPCAWSAAPPSITLAAGQTSAGNTVRLMSGSVLKVHLDDPGQFMTQKTTAGFAPLLSLGVYDTRTTLQPMHLSARTVTSADYQVTIPLDTRLTFSIYSHDLALTDAASAPLASGAASTVFQHTTGDPNPPGFSFHVTSLLH
jgi:hypothetical protein